MQVIDIGSKTSNKKKTDLLEVLDDLRKQIEEGNIEEYVIASIDKDGEVQLHTVVKDVPGGIGLFEIGKTIFFQRQQMMNIYDN